MIDFSLNTVRRARACEMLKESYVKMDFRKEKALDKERVGDVFWQISLEKAQ